jgi:hypothetical protein
MEEAQILQGCKIRREEIRDEDVGSVIFPKVETRARAKFTSRRRHTGPILRNKRRSFMLTF